ILIHLFSNKSEIGVLTYFWPSIFFFLQWVSFKTIKIKILTPKKTRIYRYFCIFIFIKKWFFAIKLANTGAVNPKFFYSIS
ncbi:hypothetical protein, partial [Mesomycoplasma ovipneumoniae]